MYTCKCKNVALMAVVCLGGLLALYVSSRRSSHIQTSARKLRALLQPTFGLTRARFSPPDLSTKEILEARVLALRAYCRDHTTTGDHRAQARSGQSKPWRGAEFHLAWCGHPLTLTKEVSDNLERLSEENREKEILLDRDRYLSMTFESNATVMFWNIVEHPLLLLMKTYLSLRQRKPESAALASLLGGRRASLLDVVRLALAAKAGPAATVLLPASRLCDVCSAHFDFVLHAGDLAAELDFLSGEMRWANTWPAAVEAEREQEQLLRETALGLATVPRHLMQLVKQHFAADLQAYGFEFDLDAIYEAVLWGSHVA